MTVLATAGDTNRRNDDGSTLRTASLSCTDCRHTLRVTASDDAGLTAAAVFGAVAAHDRLHTLPGTPAPRRTYSDVA